jgi:formate dehydrogenase iron-sulfur subunit
VTVELAVRKPDAARMGFFTDTTTCIGCKACEVACKQWNDLPADGSTFKMGDSYDHTGTLSASTWRHVRFVEMLSPVEVKPTDGARDADALDLVGWAENGGTGPAVEDRWLFMSDVCKHCTHAGCLDACPTGALIRTEFETVILQPDVCNGCGYCVPACPYGVVARDHDDGRAAKCTLCYDRLQDGMEPACAKACPTDSIQFGPYDELLGIAERRVGELRRRGVEKAHLYGADEAMAGGLGAFFLLTEAPERFGLPARADSPVQENVVPATLAGMAAGLAAAAGVALAFVTAKGKQNTPQKRFRGLTRNW